MLALELKRSKTGPHPTHFTIYEIRRARDASDRCVLARFSVPLAIPQFNPGRAFYIGKQVGLPPPQGGLVDQEGAFHFDSFTIFRFAAAPYGCMYWDQGDEPLSGVTVPFDAFHPYLHARLPDGLPVSHDDSLSWSRGRLQVSDHGRSWHGFVNQFSPRTHGAFAGACDFHPNRVRSSQTGSGTIDMHACVSVLQDDPIPLEQVQHNNEREAACSNPPRWIHRPPPSHGYDSYLGTAGERFLGMHGDAYVLREVSCPAL